MFLQLWQQLTDAQASLLSTALIIVAGGLGVLLSATLFGGRVKNLETALKKTEEELNRSLAQSATRFDQFNAQLAEKLGAVDEQFSATLDGLGQIRQSVASLQDAANEKVLTLRDQLRAHWLVIASRIEEIASDSKVHGRRRARYSKIPRRTMDPLLGALIEDEILPTDKIDAFKEAVGLWNYYKNGKATLPQSDVDKMRDLAVRLVPTYNPD